MRDIPVNLPNWVIKFNYLGTAVGGSDRLVGLDPDELLATAQQISNYEDYGDMYWIRNFRNYIARFTPNLHVLGRIRFRAEVLRALSNRLLVEQYLSQNQAVLHEKIESPVFIMGYPRTGTSILFELLAQHPDLCPPLTWDFCFPVKNEANTRDLIKATQGIYELVNEIQPAIQAMHEARWDLPAECIETMKTTFTSFGHNDYDSSEIKSAYLWHKKILQILQFSKNSRVRWVLKCPIHLLYVNELLSVYPDARIIYTHRDLSKSIPSFINLNRAAWSAYSNEPIIDNPGKVVNSAEITIKKLIKLRDNSSIDDLILDINYSDFIKYPSHTLTRIYGHAGLNHEKAYLESAMKYLAEKPKDKYGKHCYDAVDLNLSRENIRERFRFYFDRYDIPVEE